MATFGSHGEMTARDVVATGGTSFSSRAQDLAERGSARISDRWAPESQAAVRMPALRSLAFADSILAPRARRAAAAEGAPTRAVEMAAQAGAAWWLFPVPWYLDDMAAAQHAAQHPRGVAAPAAAMPAWRAQAQRDADVAMGRTPVDMPQVAAMSAAGTVPSQAAYVAAVQAAAQAAEQVAGLRAPAARAAMPSTSSAPSAPSAIDTLAATQSAAHDAPSAAAFPGAAFPGVALPPEVAAAVGADPGVFAPPSASESSPSASPFAASFARAEMPAAAAFGRTGPYQTTPPVSLRAWTPLVSAPAAQAAELLWSRRVAPTESARGVDTSWFMSALVAPVDDFAPRPAQPASAARAPLATPAAVAASETRAAIARSVAAGVPAQVAVAQVMAASAGVPAPETPFAPGAAGGAIAESTAAAGAPAVAGAPSIPASFFAPTPSPAAGPRVWMPAGLEGLAAGIGAASVVEQARGGTLAASAPAPLAHVAWADAWLERVIAPAAAEGARGARLAQVALTSPSVLTPSAIATAALLSEVVAAGGARPGSIFAPRSEAPRADAQAFARPPMGTSAPEAVYVTSPDAPRALAPAGSSAAAATAAPRAVAPAGAPTTPSAAPAARALAAAEVAAAIAGTASQVAAGTAPQVAAAGVPAAGTPAALTALTALTGTPAAQTFAPAELAAYAAAASSPAAPAAAPFAASPAVAPYATPTPMQAAASFLAAMPVGAAWTPLGAGIGLSSGLAASPVVQVAAAASGLPAQAAPLTAAEVSRAPLEHVAWADNWLSRFAGGPAAAPSAAAPGALPAPSSDRAPGYTPFEAAVYVATDGTLVRAAAPSALAAPAAAPSFAAPRAAAAPFTPAAAASILASIAPELVSAPAAPAFASAPTAPIPAPAGTPAELVAPDGTVAPQIAVALAVGVPSATIVAALTSGGPSALAALVAAASPAAASPAALSASPSAAGAMAARAEQVSAAIARQAAFSATLPAALVASPAAAALGDLLGLPAGIAAGAAPLGLRLPFAWSPQPGAAPEARWALPDFIYPQVADQAAAPRAAARPADSTPARPLFAPQAQASMRPGSLGARAEAFSIGEKLRATDLALDFVSPELVAAARVYGFSAADAARAARLAEGGQPLLLALAAGVDMSLVAFDTAGRALMPASGPSAAPSVASAAPGLTGEDGASLPAEAFAALSGASPAARLADLRAGRIPADFPLGAMAPALTLLSGTATPRGSFLQPQASLEAMRQRAPRGAAAQASPVAPLELAALDVLAASAVAGGIGGATLADSWGGTAAAGTLGAARALFEGDFTLPGWQAPPAVAGTPSVRAARALASVASGSTAPQSMPTAAGQDREHVIAAGESLQSLVAPTVYAPGASPTQQYASAPAATRGYEVPSAAPDLVSGSGASAAPAASASPGGSDWQVPSWFEDVARKMLGSKGADDKLGLPELTLITSVAQAPQQRMAAAEKRISSSPTGGTQKGNGSPNKELLKEEDINQLARDVYDEIRRLFEAARERNGDPWRT